MCVLREAVLLYGLLSSGVVSNLSSIARSLDVAVNTVWRWVKDYERAGVLGREGGKYVITDRARAVREVAAYLLKLRDEVAVLKLLARLPLPRWGISGTYALYYYDLLDLTPVRPPILLITTEDAGLAKGLMDVLAPIMRFYDIKFTAIVRRELVMEPDPPIADVPAASPGDALLDALEGGWVGMDSPLYAAQALYTYSGRLEDYAELVRKAVRCGCLGTLKLMNLAAGLAKEVTQSIKWYRIYYMTYLALGRLPVKPSNVDYEIIEQLHFALVKTLMPNRLYEAVVRKFTHMSEGAARRIVRWVGTHEGSLQVS